MLISNCNSYTKMIKVYFILIKLNKSGWIEIKNYQILMNSKHDNVTCININKTYEQ